MVLPKINDVITAQLAVELCDYYGLNYLSDRIQDNPENYKEWIFDGASMIDDAIFSDIFDLPNIVEISLKHDLKYAYGDHGNHEEKLIADLEFQIDLLRDGASTILSRLMFSSVDVFGYERLGTSFSWGFASDII